MKDTRFNSEKKGMYYPIYYLKFLTCSDYGLLVYDAVQSYQWIPFLKEHATSIFTGAVMGEEAAH